MTYLQPLLPVLLLALTLCSLTRSVKWARAILLVAVGGLWFISLPALPLVFLRPQEKSLQTARCRLKADARRDRAIVVLASTVSAPMPGSDEPLLGADTRERCVYAAELYRRLGGIPIFTSGGGGADVPDGSYAAAMKRVLIEEGVPAEAVFVETRSHSTRENSVYSASLLRERAVQTVVLVTSAYHMGRAAKCFRNQGFNVLQAGCDFRISSPLCWQDWLPSASFIETNEALLHEWIGFVYYYWKGWV